MFQNEKLATRLKKTGLVLIGSFQFSFGPFFLVLQSGLLNTNWKENQGKSRGLKMVQLKCRDILEINKILNIYMNPIISETNQKEKQLNNLLRHNFKTEY